MEGISRRKEYEALRVEDGPTITGQRLMTKLNPWIGGVLHQPIKEGILYKKMLWYYNCEKFGIFLMNVGTRKKGRRIKKVMKMCIFLMMMTMTQIQFCWWPQHVKKVICMNYGILIQGVSITWFDIRNGSQT